MRTDKLTLGFAYLRLSNEEAQGGESSSITNQRMIVQNYCKQNGITLVREFVDDGYSGGNFDRPAFQEMMRQLSQGKANTVITKDLSRLGRDMREASYYAEQFFPEHGIRYIAIGDSVRVEFSAYPDEIWNGTVTSVTTTKTSDYAATVSYPVKIQVEGDTERLFGGMTAEITFVSEAASDVLYISRKAIVEQEGSTFVYVGSGEEKQLKEVVTGLENSTQVEIREGLSEGDTVYIPSVTN